MAMIKNDNLSSFNYIIIGIKSLQYRDTHIEEHILFLIS